jgi:hypothetical protein
MDEDKIKCEICGQRVHLITWKHLKMHGLNRETYRELFPNSPYISISSKNKYANSARKGHVSFRLRDPEAYKLRCIKAGQKGGKLGGKRVKELYPNMASENGKKYGRLGALTAHQRHPNMTSKVGKMMWTERREFMLKVASLGGKTTHIRHPEQYSIMGKRAIALHPEKREFMRSIQKLGCKISGKVVHLKYPNMARENGYKSIMIRKARGTYEEEVRRAGIKLHQMYPDLGKRAAKLGYEAHLRNSPYEYDKQKFPSKEQMKIYIYLKSLGVQFEHEYLVGYFRIDFFIADKLFLEHHPARIFGHVNNTEEYYKERRDILNKNSYPEDKYPLFVTTSLKELNKLKEKLIELNIIQKEPELCIPVAA